MNKKLLTTVIASLLACGFSSNAIAKQKQQHSEIDDYCYRSPKNSICADKESYISLKKWDKHRTECALAGEWEELKCKVVVGDRELIVYVEEDVVSDSLPNTLKTEEIRIPLDNMFAFDTQWWLASRKTSLVRVVNIIGSFPSLKIGYVPVSNDSSDSSGKFLTISAKSLHHTMEEIESWRYYLPDLQAFKAKLKFDPNRVNQEKTVASNIARLEETGECPYCNLENADLTEMDLYQANLQGANLQGANLEESSLEESYLLGANLNQANLHKAKLEEVNLMFASLENADLSETNIKGANLQSTNLNNALLSGADLNSDKLENTNLKNASLISADLSDANLQCVDLQSANLKNANLTKVNLSSCEHESGRTPSNLKLNNRGYFKSVQLNGGIEGLLGVVELAARIAAISAPSPNGSSNVGLPSQTTVYQLDSNLGSANFSGANLTDANLNNAQLTDVNLSQAILDNTKFADNNLSNANFINTDISEVDFGNDPIAICEATFSDETIYEEYCFEEEEEE